MDRYTVPSSAQKRETTCQAIQSIWRDIRFKILIYHLDKKIDRELAKAGIK